MSEFSPTWNKGTVAYNNCVFDQRCTGGNKYVTRGYNAVDLTSVTYNGCSGTVSGLLGSTTQVTNLSIVNCGSPSAKFTTTDVTQASGAIQATVQLGAVTVENCYMECKGPLICSVKSTSISITDSTFKLDQWLLAPWEGGGAPANTYGTIVLDNLIIERGADAAAQYFLVDLSPKNTVAPAAVTKLDSVSITNVQGNAACGLIYYRGKPAAGLGTVQVSDNNFMYGGHAGCVMIGHDTVEGGWTINSITITNNRLTAEEDGNHGISIAYDTDGATVSNNIVVGSDWGYVVKGQHHTITRNIGYCLRGYLDMNTGNTCEYNTFYVTATDATSHRHAVDIRAAAVGGVFKNNIVVFDTTGKTKGAGEDYRLFAMRENLSSSAFICDYNCYYHIRGLTESYLWVDTAASTSGQTLASLQDAWSNRGLTNDTHSVYVDPVIRSVDYASDYFMYLSSFSSVRNKSSDGSNIGYDQTDAVLDLTLLIADTEDLTNLNPIGERAATRGNEIIVQLGTVPGVSVAHTETQWLFTSAANPTEQFIVTTNANGIVTDRPLGNVGYGSLTELRIDLDRVVDYVVQVKINNDGDWSEPLALDMQPRMIASKHKTEAVVVPTTTGATVTPTYPKWVEYRTANRVVIEPLTYVDEPRSNKPVETRTSSGATIRT